MRRQGVIQRWDDGKGFGYIRPHDGGPDLFVHASACQLRQTQRPAPGVEVSFETERGRDGRAQAAGVLPLHGWPTVDALPAGAVEQRRRNADEARAARPQRTAASRSERAQRGGPSLRVAGLSIAALLLVLIVELLNSAIEAVVDRVSLERHPLAKRAKDVGSAAVFVALANVVAVWGCVLFL